MQVAITSLRCRQRSRKSSPGIVDAQQPAIFLAEDIFCLCHGSQFDLPGRVLNNVSIPTNLEIPPYRYPAEASLLVGADGNT
jgi:hypothetical protein